EIVTQTGLLQAVAELATKAHIAPFVSFQLADVVIEAEGALGIDMLDAWAGFLQAYSSRFADAVSLRSYVQQRNPDGAALPVAPGMALYLGEAEPDGRSINMQRLRDGTYTAADLLIGGDAAATAGRTNDVSEAQEPRPPAPSYSPATTRRSVDMVKLLNSSAEGTSLADLTIKAIQLWEADKLKELEGGAMLHKAIDKLKERAIFPGASPAQYKTVLAQRRRAPSRACWAGSRLSMQNAVGAVFWLDLFSKNDMVTLADFESAYGELLVEAALNPLQTAKCVGVASDGSLHSHYLETVSKEPHTIRTLLSALPAYSAQKIGRASCRERV